MLVVGGIINLIWAQLTQFLLSCLFNISVHLAIARCYLTSIQWLLFMIVWCYSFNMNRHWNTGHLKRLLNRKLHRFPLHCGLSGLGLLRLVQLRRLFRKQTLILNLEFLLIVEERKFNCVAIILISQITTLRMKKFRLIVNLSLFQFTVFVHWFTWNWLTFLFNNCWGL